MDATDARRCHRAALPVRVLLCHCDQPFPHAFPSCSGVHEVRPFTVASGHHASATAPVHVLALPPMPFVRSLLDVLSRCPRLPMTLPCTRLQRPALPAPSRPLLPLITVSGPHLFTAVPDVLPSPRLPDGPCRLGEGRACRHQVVDQHDKPFGQQTSAAGNHGQRTREILQPLPRVEPRLVGHPPPLPQYGHHPRMHPRPPQLPRRRERDPPRRIMPPSPNRPPRGRHGNEQHRHTEPVPPPPAPEERLRPQATAPGGGLTTQHAALGPDFCSWHISTPGQRFYSWHVTTPAQSRGSRRITAHGQSLRPRHATTPGQSCFTCTADRPRPPLPTGSGRGRTRSAVPPAARTHRATPPQRSTHPTSPAPVKAHRHPTGRRTPHLSTGPDQSPAALLPGPPRPPRRKSPTARLTHLPHRRTHRPRKSRTERRSQTQRPPLLVGQQHRPYRVRIPSSRVHDRQSGRLRHRSYPARCGPVQGGTALRTEHRARPPTAPALGRQHQIGQVPPPPPHAHHCANTEPDRPPLWITPCGKPPSARTTVPTTISGLP
ncbi:hypothetical protein QF027_003892 [Streptomyces canus]|nr:hypothetical protein [Streptomyces canus]